MADLNKQIGVKGIRLLGVSNLSEEEANEEVTYEKICLIYPLIQS